ncbi:hypothetical protein N1851_004008 [Merluccius polli]|uniref:Reverse transcriptase domain-containing protein n=1 Tax=Merluccius polli TaxID=89951 RepID=A0AA47N7M6_MERPO|nr:hypothetical protein N1851_004008 [Merluccius polli]
MRRPRLSVLPACFKRTAIVAVPKSTNVTRMNDDSPVALTSVIMKCFERLVKSFICSSLPSTLDSMQFAYRSNRSMGDAIALTVHTARSHLDKGDTYTTAPAFNTIIPSRLLSKQVDPGTKMDHFLMGRPQVFADKTAIVGLISDSDESSYREEVGTMAAWCQGNHLTLNGGNINGDLRWCAHTGKVISPEKCLFFLRRLKTSCMDPVIFTNVYRCTIESILTGCITVWYGSCIAKDRKAQNVRASWPLAVAFAEAQSGPQAEELSRVLICALLSTGMMVLNLSAHQAANWSPPNLLLGAVGETRGPSRCLHSETAASPVRSHQEIICACGALWHAGRSPPGRRRQEEDRSSSAADAGHVRLHTIYKFVVRALGRKHYQIK